MKKPSVFKKKRNTIIFLLIVLAVSILIIFAVAEINKKNKIKKSLEFLDAGKVAFNNKNHENAIKNLKISIKFNPNNYEAYKYLGSSYEMLGQPEQAIKYYRKSLSLNKNDAETYRLLGNVYSYINEPELARSQFKKAVEQNPKDFLALNGLGLSYMRLGNYEKSLLYYNQSLNVMYNEPAFEGLGKVYYLTEDYNKAYDYLSKSNPNNSQAVSYLIATYNAIGLYDEAIELAQHKLKTESNNSHYYKKIGIAYFFKGDNENDLINLKKAVELEPSASTNQLSISIVYLGLKDLDNANEHIKKALELSEESTVYEALSIYFMLIGDAEEAEKKHRLAINFVPHSFGFSMIGYALLDLKIYDNAIGDFNLAIQTKPDYYLPYKGLAKAYLGLGQEDKAKEHLEKAWELNKLDKEVKELLDSLNLT